MVLPQSLTRDKKTRTEQDPRTRTILHQAVRPEDPPSTARPSRQPTSGERFDESVDRRKRQRPRLATTAASCPRVYLLSTSPGTNVSSLIGSARSTRRSRDSVSVSEFDGSRGSPRFARSADSNSSIASPNADAVA